MAMRRRSGDVGEASPPWVPRSDNAGSVEDVIAGLADLDANALQLQGRNHLGGTPPAHLPRWLLLKSWRIRSRLPHSAVPTKRRCASFANRKAELSTPPKAVRLKLASPRRGKGPLSEREQCWSASGRASWKGLRSWKRASPGMRLKEPAHPGSFVKHEVLTPLELSVTEAADVLGVTRPALSALLSARISRRIWQYGSKKHSACRWKR